MDPRRALETFRSLLESRELGEDVMLPDDGIHAMLDFYRNERADGCAFDRDADMLLFQWGTHDWGSGEVAEVNITRQLILGEDAEDEAIWQLSLSFLYEPEDPLKGLKHGDLWCGSDAELDAFTEMIEQSEAYLAVARRLPKRIELTYESAG